MRYVVGYKKRAQLFGAVWSGAALFVLSTLSLQAVASNLAPQGFTIQGELTNASGTAPLTDTNVQLTISIYDPASACLLYQETQTGIDLSATGGLFAVQVGSATGDPKRVAGVDPGLSMAQVFANTGTQTRAAGANCAAGYTPASGDVRMLRIKVNAASIGIVTLSPDQTLGSVPQALVAQTLQGLDVSQFLQVNAGANLSQSTLQTLTNASDASTLHNHDSLYVKIGTGASQNIGSGSFYTSGSMGVGTLVAPVGTQLQVDTSSSTTKGLVIQGSASQSANLFEVDNSAGSPLIGIDGSGNFSVKSGNIGVGTTAPAKALDIQTAGAGARIYNTTASSQANFNIRNTTANFSLIADLSANNTNNFSVYDNVTSTSRLFIDPSGNVGIGTTTPARQLHVLGNGTNAPEARFEYSSGSSFIEMLSNAASTDEIDFGISGGVTNSGRLIYVPSTNAMLFYTNSSERMRVDTSGNVGIGTTAPASLLTVGNNNFMVNGTGAVTSASSAGQSFFIGHQQGPGYTYAPGIFRAMTDNATGSANYYYDGVTNGTTNFSVRADGQGYFAGSVGIGTSNPQRTLNVVGSGIGVEDATTANIHTFADVNGGATIDAFDGGTGSSYFAVKTNANGASTTEKFRITGLGAVGIGTTSPNATLQVNGTITGKAAVSNAGTTIDFSTGNAQYTSGSCGVFNLNNLKDGGSYVFAVQGATSATCAFNAYSDAGTTALTVHLPPNHGSTTANTHTLYNFMVLGTHVYVAWTPNY